MAAREIIRRVNFAKIQNKAYELYKIDWMDTHLSLQEVRTMWDEYETFKQKCNEKKVRYPEFDSYVESMGGWGGMIFACKAEFLENEFLDGDYMAYLLEDYPEMYDSYVGNAKIKYKIHYGNELSGDALDQEILNERNTVILDDYER